MKNGLLLGKRISFGPVRRWMDARRGNIVLLAALVMLPFIAIVGFTMDFQFVEGQRTKVQAAIDAAVLQGARLRQAGLSEQSARTKMREYFDSTLSVNGTKSDCQPLDVVYSTTSKEIDATVTCSQKTIFSLVLGKDKIDYKINSSSTYGIGKLDVAFVFDSSGSMGGQKLLDLKAAATSAVNTILPEYAVAGGEIRIAMITYNDMVNAGDYFPAVADQTTYSTPGGPWLWVSDWNSPNWSCTNQWDYSWTEGWRRRCQGMVQTPWPHTCVFERDGSNAFTAATPSSGGKLKSGSTSQNGCPPTKPLPLTNNRTKLFAYITSLTAEGGTAGHQGTAWGWYLIAEEWADIWPEDSTPMDYDEPDSAKAMILMTDGDFNSQYYSSQGSSTSQAKKLCDNIKKKGITIYTVAFQAPYNARQTLAYCASGPDFAFDPSNGEELDQAYQAIASSINDLRISK